MRNYRFQKLTTVYPQFVHQFLAENKDYAELSYKKLFDRFVKTRYGLSDYYSKYLNILGNEAEDIFVSIEPLQKTWAEENNVVYHEESWTKDIALAQIEKFKPEIVYLQDLYLFDFAFRNQIREMLGEKVLLIGWRAAPTADFSVFRDLDVVATCVPNFVKKLEENGAKALLIPLAHEHSISKEMEVPREQDLEFSFIGSLGYRNGYHSKRYKVIETLLDSTSLEVWGDVPSSVSSNRVKAIYETNRFLKESIGLPENILKKVPYFRRGASWKADPTLLSLKQLHPHRFHEPVFGIEYFQTLARSKMTFNMHINCAEDYAGNMRLFEATGMGACLLTDWKQNLSSYFELDTEIVTYRSVDECISKVKYLLEHEEERLSIAQAGQRRVLKEHTWQQRVNQLHENIENKLLSI
ncbi:MAG: hypothetical protein HLUCCA11_17900 [Phormidesmis priestleyi Ana]|uniref:Spore protein YkvP/CgeB glycosyl transferase-like domain-containing protein n=1 Tax=Phormidesmis priestleyi Ana TaxID=1666911 RepID=A0A0N8KMF7_9CYAN|nr:MAG: hypothetical protein HLUCCA11_17900 [Phormidesmis priestleyi Ana]